MGSKTGAHALVTAVILALALTTAKSASAIAPASSASVRMAEYLFYSIPRSGLLVDWLDSIKMTPDRRAELRDLVEKSKQKKAKVPPAEWLTGSAVIKMGSGARIYKVGFNKIISRRELLINGTAFSTTDGSDFSETAKVLTQLAAPKDGSNEGLAALVFYQFGLDEADACLNSKTRSKCASKSDASIVTNLIGEGGSINRFQCEGKKFSAISLTKPAAVGQPPIAWEIAYEYDKKGKANKVSLSSHGQALCIFTLEAGNVSSVEDVIQGRGNCDARAASEWNTTYRPLQPGDTPKVFALIPLPIPRLQACCADRSCRDELAEAVVPGSVTAIPDTGATTVAISPLPLNME